MTIAKGTMCRITENVKLNIPELAGHLCTVTGGICFSFSEAGFFYPVSIPGWPQVVDAAESVLIPIVPPGNLREEIDEQLAEVA